MWRSAEDGSPAHVVTNESAPVDIAGCVRPLRRFGAPAPPSAHTLVSGRLASPLPARTRLHLIVWTPVALAPHSSNNQDVAPPGSWTCNAVALVGVTRYRCHGGGPADGALYGAVSAVPDSSTSHGQPPAAYRSAAADTRSGSVTSSAVPSTTTSYPFVESETAHRGSRSRFRPLRAVRPDTIQYAPSSHRAPTPVTCGLPWALVVVSQAVYRPGPPSASPACPSGREADAASQLRGARS